MKHLYKIFAFAAVAVVALVSCNKENDLSDPNSITIRVRASVDELKGADPESKTYIGTYEGTANTILWGTGEYMKLALTAGETTNFANSTDESANVFNGDPQAMFEFDINPGEASEYVYQGLYPASAAATSSNTNAANYKVNLPAIQNATASSYDPAAYIMVAKPETFSTVQTDWEAWYRRATALNKITLKNFASSVSINKVKITAEGKKLAGGRHFNLTTGEGLEVYGTDATIEVLYATPLTGTRMDIWFTSWDAEIAEGEKLTVIAYTTDGESYTKEITVPAGRSIKFQEGYLNNTGVSMSGITPEEVTTIEGDFVILAKNNDTYYALKGEASGTRIASVDYNGSTSSYAGDASIIWTIATSGTGYTIKNGSNFIGWTSGNTADLVDEDDYDATQCLMGIDDNGDGTYKIYVAADVTRILARNASNAYFGFYTGSGYNSIVLVPATTMEQVETPTFNPAAGEVTSGTEVAISCATSGATIHYTIDGTDPTSSSATYSSPIAITATTTIKAIAVKSGMADSAIATATYSVTSAGSVTLTENDITAGSNTAQGTNNSVLAYRLGTGNNNGSLTFPAGYSTITFTLAGWASGTRSFSITNGKIAGSESLSPEAGSPSGTINDGFNTTYSGTEYTIEVTDPTQEVVFSGRRCIVWGFTAIESGGSSDTYDFETVAELNGKVTSTSATYSGYLTNAVVSFVPNANTAIVKDATGSITFYKSSHGLLQGQIYTGEITVTALQYTQYSNSYSEVTAWNAEFTGTEASVAAQSATLSTLVGNYITWQNAYVQVSDLEVTSVSGKNVNVSNGSNTYLVYTNYGNATCVVGDILTVKGTVSHHGDDDQIKVWASGDITVTYHPSTQSKTVAQVLAAGAGTYDMEDLLVYCVSGKNVIVGDSSGKMLLFIENHGLTTGDIISIEDAVATVYQSTTLEITAGTIAKTSTGNAVNHGTATDLNDPTLASSTHSAFSASGFHSAVYVSMDGSQSGQNITGKNDNTTLHLNAANAVTDGKNVSVEGYIYSWSSSYGNYNFQAVSIAEDNTTPYISVSPTSLSWAATEYGSSNSKSITVTLNGAASAGDYNISGSSSAWTVTKNGNTITVYPNAENTSTTVAKSITLTIAHADNSTVYQQVTCTQAKKPASGSPAAGTVLWTDSFGDWGGTSTTFTQLPELSNYTYSGRSGYSGNTDVTLTASNNQVRGASSSATNMTSGHLWFNKSQDATLTTSAIRLYGSTSLILTYDQATSGSSLTASYSVNGGSTWTDFEASGPAANISRTFTVPSGTTSVLLRFSHASTNAKNTRFDNPKLTVGN